MQGKISILSTFNKSNCYESFLKVQDHARQEMQYDFNYAYKVYPFQMFIDEQRTQLEFINEYNVTKLIREKQCKYLLPLLAVYLGQDHIVLKFQKMKFDLRNYLYWKRNPRDL